MYIHRNELRRRSRECEEEFEGQNEGSSEWGKRERGNNYMIVHVLYTIIYRLVFEIDVNIICIIRILL